MRDHHFVKTGRKKYADEFDDIIIAVKKIYPKAIKEGSTGGWSWAIGEEIVAEAWIHRTRSGWWFRIKEGLMYAVSALIVVVDSSGQKIVDLPTFYLDASVQGILDKAQAERIAKDIILPIPNPKIEELHMVITKL